MCGEREGVCWRVERCVWDRGGCVKRGSNINSHLSFPQLRANRIQEKNFVLKVRRAP